MSGRSKLRKKGHCRVKDVVNAMLTSINDGWISLTELEEVLEIVRKAINEKKN